MKMLHPLQQCPVLFFICLKTINLLIMILSFLPALQTTTKKTIEKIEYKNTSNK